MRNYRKSKKPYTVFSDVSGVMIALCDKKPHDGRGYSADNMAGDYPPIGKITRENSPHNMVHGHCDNCDYFYGICI